MASAPKDRVYLEHHIKREPFLYQQGATSSPLNKQMQPHLTILDLSPGPASKAPYLRKPDFQRATWAWSPEDCAQLLADVLANQVVPSVIMWYSDDRRKQYVLDGGHRISVLLAWIRNDWGDGLTPTQMPHPGLRAEAQRAGQEVRRLLRERHRIGTFEEHMDAARRVQELESDGRDPSELATMEDVLNNSKRAADWSAMTMGFPILWVQGDYKRAEESFLRINRTGRSLTEWEKTLVLNRRSSFARAVMAVANPQDADRIWPAPHVQHLAPAAADLLTATTRRIHERSRELHHVLFEPPYTLQPIAQRQPVLATAPGVPEQRPQYLSELLTVTESRREQKSESMRLLLTFESDYEEKRKVTLGEGEVVHRGLRLLNGAASALEHLHGPEPVSLGLVPLLYYYNPRGTYIRNLLYGMVYWLNTGMPEQIADRKVLFTAYREQFEDVIVREKDAIVQRTSRRIGSGAETTVQTASYYNGLLHLLIQHGRTVDISSAAFRVSHARLVETLGLDTPSRGDDTSARDSRAAVGADGGAPQAGSSIAPQGPRTFRGRNRAAVTIPNIVNSMSRCEICGGRFIPGHDTQVDHRVPYAAGGPTNPRNGRETHPFCNNRRELIERVKSGQIQVTLPAFLLAPSPAAPRAEQLTFMDMLAPSPEPVLTFEPDPDEDRSDAFEADDVEDEPSTEPTGPEIAS